MLRFFCRKKLRELVPLLTKSENAVCIYYTSSIFEKGRYGMIAAFKKTKKESLQESIKIPELYGQKLLRYAESFEELARSMMVTCNEGEEGEPNEQTEQVEQENGLDRRELLEIYRRLESRQFISHNFREIARIMAGLAGEIAGCEPMDERIRKILVHALRAESIFAEDFCYLSRKENDRKMLSVQLYTDLQGGYEAAQVANMLSVLLNKRLQLSAASPYQVTSEKRGFVFVEEPGFVALTGFCKVTKEGEHVSGDHYSVLESEKGRLSLILSDGTGSGEKASRDSEKVLDLMEKFLEAGYDREAAIDMVNAAFFAGGRKYRHPTLDICDLNLYDGTCIWCKVGGADSFIKHGTHVETIHQGTLPLGIFHNLEAETVERKLSNGDYVILVTDGVLDALGENYERIVEEVVGKYVDVCPGEIAEKILEAALLSCGGHIQDDMTVLTAGIWENTPV